MREGNDYETWDQPRSLVVAGVAFAVSLLFVGTLTARVLGPVESASAGMAETPRPDAIEPEIGSAVVEYPGPVPAAATDHLGVVRLSTTTCGERRSGSGIVVADGLVLTAAHVVGDAELVRVDVAGSTATGEVVGVAIDGRDVALVDVDIAVPEPLRPSAALREGEAVTLVGHPEGGSLVEVVGPHVVPSEAVQAVAPDAAIAVTAVVSEGMSGGPAVDPTGALVGVISSIEVVTGTAFVVPVDLEVDVLPESMVDGACPAAA